MAILPAARPAVCRVSSWGRLSNDTHTLVPLHERRVLPLGPAGQALAAPFGNGRSYGDACLNPGARLWTTRGLDRFIAFDAATGQLECEAGVLLDEIITLALPRGWFLPVTPGTRFATLGGAIANDVHGKNHHRAGTLGEHILSLTLLRSDGSRIECSSGEQAPWLAATIGGLGLTGVIASARLQLRPVRGAWMDTESVVFGSLDEFFALSRDAESGWDYAVSWVDCVHGRGRDARGVFFRANHADEERAAPPVPRRSIPFTPPFSLFNGVSLRALNAAYFRLHQVRAGSHRQPLLPFFYPLDGLLGWNRLYGRRGFYQYQCVVPRAAELQATGELLAQIRASGLGSLLAVLKTFGERPPAGMLSFPMPGTTLALDFPNQGERTTSLFLRLDAIVRAAGGRLYLAKDARMSRDFFEHSYPRREEFLPFRDPGISSGMSRRLLGA